MKPGRISRIDHRDSAELKVDKCRKKTKTRNLNDTPLYRSQMLDKLRSHLQGNHGRQHRRRPPQPRARAAISGLGEDTLGYTTLYCTVLYYTILYYTILYYTMLCYAMLCYATLCYVTLSGLRKRNCFAPRIGRAPGLKCRFPHQDRQDGKDRACYFRTIKVSTITASISFNHT